MIKDLVSVVIPCYNHEQYIIIALESIIKNDYQLKEIILIDNYIDESVLAHLCKRATNVDAIIYTKSISRVLQLDLERHNSQYPPIQIRELRESHDRFLIIDRNELYHIGASLKDLGKKWFGFSKLDGTMLEFVLSKLLED